MAKGKEIEELRTFTLPETITLEDLEDEELSVFDMPLIHVGMGGTKAWITQRGAEIVDADLSGVILAHKTNRVYYPGAYKGGNELPQCSSVDGRTGIGNPGGECKPCEKNEFGSRKGDEAGKACAEKRMLYLLQEGHVIPIIVQVSAGSLKSFRSYLYSMVNHGGIKRFITNLGIEEGQGSHGSFDRITFERGQKLDDTSYKRIREYSDELSKILVVQRAPVAVQE